MPVSENWGRGIIGPNIVLDGLVAYHDIANPNSYPGSGNTINDLAPLRGLSTASLSQVGGGITYNSTFPQSLTFISGSGVRASGSFKLTNFGPSFTAIIVASSPTPTWNPNGTAIIGYRGGALVAGGGNNSATPATSGFIFSAWYNTNFNSNQIQCGIKQSAGGDAQYQILLTGVDITKPHVYYLSYNEGTALTLGSLTLGYDTTFSTVQTLTLNRIPSDVNLYYSWQDEAGYPSRYLTYNMYLGMIYNRALTTTELTQTYYALKSRFGIV